MNNNELEIKAEEVLEENTEFIKNEMLKYRGNSLSHKLGFLAILFSVLACFIGLNSMRPNTFETFLKIGINIVVLLFGFLNCEKAKNYSKSGSITLIVFGLISIARIFWYPLNLIRYQIMYNSGTDAEKALALTKLGNILTGGRDINWLPADGVFRGILAIVFLGISAAAFICAGIYGLKKAKQLEDFMEENK